MTDEFLLEDISIGRQGEFRESLSPHLMFFKYSKLKVTNKSKRYTFGIAFLELLQLGNVLEGTQSHRINFAFCLECIFDLKIWEYFHKLLIQSIFKLK